MGQNDTFVCSKGLLFPSVVERQWSVTLRACLHLIALIYAFVGMAIIAEVFMSAIKRITSTTKKVPIAKDDQCKNKPIEYKEVRIWNPTVANVSLMALGASAAEILISVIEVLGNNFKVGELGPGTIVGSAAFNLMVTNAVCIASVPNGEKKKISKISVYCVTAFWNVFAYLWLLFILMGPSKDEVEIWEGALTFIFFFILIITAYITDIKLYRKCFKRSSNKPNNVVHESTHIINLDVGHAVTVDVSETNGSSSNLERRQIEKTSLEFQTVCDEELAKVVTLKINAQRPKVFLVNRIDAIRTLPRTSALIIERFIEPGKSIKDQSSRDSEVEFKARANGIENENQMKVVLKVIRRGSNEKRVSFKYKTVDSVAKSDVHFISKSEILTFDSGENEKFITISLVQDAKWMKDDVFIVVLTPDPSTPEDRTKIGNCNTAEVFFVGNEDKETNSEPNFNIIQRNVSVTNNEGFTRSFNKVEAIEPRLPRSSRPWNQPWKKQFYRHMYINNGKNKSATATDYVLHVVAFPWKIICTLVPPETYLGGWLTFITALILISVVTALCMDFASTFGCLVGLDDKITAITFVTVGTGLPDTFASRIAAIQDKTADNAVGNINGCNCASVFLGLGLPWFISSIYWAVQGKSFHVPSDDIAFCVTIYCVCAVATIALLFSRRYLRFFGKAELGGARGAKWPCAIFLISIWFIYVLLSSLQVYEYIPAYF